MDNLLPCLSCHSTNISLVTGGLSESYEHVLCNSCGLRSKQGPDCIKHWNTRLPTWTCFHCDETFTNQGSARDHFGGDQDSIPGCVIKVQLGDERGLQMALRKAEKEVSRLRNDIENESTSMSVFYSRLKAYLRSYAPFRDCRDIREVFNIYDSMEGRALAAEERLENVKKAISYE